jgi:hypothetical protein
MNESVESDAFVMPRSSGRPCAGRPPAVITRSFSTSLPGNRNLSVCSRETTLRNSVCADVLDLHPRAIVPFEIVVLVVEGSRPAAGRPPGFP